MNTRQRFQAIMNFQPFDRLPVIEWAGWWDQTLARWRGEGLPPELTDRYAICGHFGLDTLRQMRFRGLGPCCPPPASHGAGIVADAPAYEAVRPHLFPPVPAGDAAQWSAWAAMLDQGATAAMEVWRLEQKGNATWCHSWAVTPIAMLIRYVMGLQPAEPGWATVRFAPHPPAGLGGCELRVRLPNGVTAEVDYRRSSDGVLYRLRVDRGVPVVAAPPVGWHGDVRAARDGEWTLE